MLEAHGVVRTVGTGRARRRVLDGAGLRVEPGEPLASRYERAWSDNVVLHLPAGR